VCDGQATIAVASRVGRLVWRRQVLMQPEAGRQVVPGDSLLPAHGGMISTRGLPEGAGLLADTLPFATAARLLGWQMQEEEGLCASTLRTLVREHGEMLARAEQAEVCALAGRVAQGDLEGLRPRLIPACTPRRRAAWPAAVSAAVDQARAAGQTQVPEGVRPCDWDRVLTARRQEQAAVPDLRCLGPRVSAGEVVVSADEVLTRRPERRAFWELRTARVVTTEGSRYVSGAGRSFLATLEVLCALAQAGLPGQAPRPLTVVVDGALWLRDFCAQALAPRGATLLLDWYHVHQRCRQVSTQVCRAKATRLRFVRTTTRLLWRGAVDGARAVAAEIRACAKATGPLDQWIHYLDARRPLIPCYRDRHRQRQSSGSGHAEKANDLLVARRQKNQGMHWSAETSVRLRRLRTLRLNGDWDAYWQQGQCPSLCAA